MRLEKYNVNGENIYILLGSNGEFYSAKDFKSLIFTFKNNIFKYDFITTNLFISGLYKENLVFSKEYNSLEELKLDNVEELI